MFRYARNNPFLLKDTYGLKTAVVVDGTSEGNPFGHTSVATSGNGVYSYGTKVGGDMDIGTSLTEYISERAQGRDLVVVTINTTAEQEKAILEFLEKYPYSLPPWIFDLFPNFMDTCATRTSDTLSAGGMPNPDPLILMGLPAFPTDVLAQAEFWRQILGGTTTYIPKGTTSVPVELTEFNPQPTP